MNAIPTINHKGREMLHEGHEKRYKKVFVPLV
jgi:hypothetical protein